MDKTNYFWRRKAGKPERARLLSNSGTREHLKIFRNDNDNDLSPLTTADIT